jgi:hypothetical protein
MDWPPQVAAATGSAAAGEETTCGAGSRSRLLHARATSGVVSVVDCTLSFWYENSQTSACTAGHTCTWDDGACVRGGPTFTSEEPLFSFMISMDMELI